MNLETRGYDGWGGVRWWRRGDVTSIQVEAAVIHKQKVKHVGVEIRYRLDDWRIHSVREGSKAEQINGKYDQQH